MSNFHGRSHGHAKAPIAQLAEQLTLKQSPRTTAATPLSLDPPENVSRNSHDSLHACKRCGQPRKKAKCLTCKRESNRRWREANPDKHRASSRNWHAAHREESRERASEWKRRARYEYRERDPAKQKAREIVRGAIRAGKLVRPANCGRCGKEGKIEAHHEDYSKPLVVQWLCQLCHGGERRKVTPRKRAAA